MADRFLVLAYTVALREQQESDTPDLAYMKKLKEDLHEVRGSNTSQKDGDCKHPPKTKKRKRK